MESKQSLKYLLCQKLKTSFLVFWLAKLAVYDYKIQGKKCNDNSVVGALSRLLPRQLMHMELDTSSPELVQKIDKS